MHYGICEMSLLAGELLLQLIMYSAPANKVTGVATVTIVQSGFFYYNIFSKILTVDIWNLGHEGKTWDICFRCQCNVFVYTLSFQLISYFDCWK